MLDNGRVLIFDNGPHKRGNPKSANSSAGSF